MLAGATVYDVDGQPVAADGHNWMHVQFNGQVGYAAMDLLQKVAACPGAAGYFCVTANPNLRLRNAPSSTATVVTMMPVGSPVVNIKCCTAANGINWRQIDFFGVIGYASNAFLTPCVPPANFIINSTIAYDPAACTGGASVGSFSVILFFFGFLLLFV